MENPTQPSASLPSGSAKFAERSDNQTQHSEQNDPAVVKHHGPQNATDYKFQFGDTVRSAALGVAKEFDGVVTYRTISGEGKPFYHVRDEHGQYWHRSAKELMPVTEAVGDHDTRATSTTSA